jgi:hypothetical protein
VHRRSIEAALYRSEEEAIYLDDRLRFYKVQVRLSLSVSILTCGAGGAIATGPTVLRDSLKSYEVVLE